MKLKTAEDGTFAAGIRKHIERRVDMGEINEENMVDVVGKFSAQLAKEYKDESPVNITEDIQEYVKECLE